MIRSFIRPLIVAEILLLVAILVGSILGMDRMLRLDPYFAAFASEHGERYLEIIPAWMGVALGAVLTLLIPGWIGLWRYQRWGFYLYAFAFVGAQAVVLADPSTISYTFPTLVFSETVSGMLSGALLLASYAGLHQGVPPDPTSK